MYCAGGPISGHVTSGLVQKKNSAFLFWEGEGDSTCCVCKHTALSGESWNAGCGPGLPLAAAMLSEPAGLCKQSRRCETTAGRGVTPFFCVLLPLGVSADCWAWCSRCPDSLHFLPLPGSGNISYSAAAKPRVLVKERLAGVKWGLANLSSEKSEGSSPPAGVLEDGLPVLGSSASLGGHPGLTQRWRQEESARPHWK